MRVRVSVYSMLREKLGWKHVDIEIEGDRATLREVLDRVPRLRELVVRDDGSFEEGFLVLINGIHAQHLGGLDAEVRDGYEIDVFPPGGGG